MNELTMQPPIWSATTTTPIVDPVRAEALRQAVRIHLDREMADDEVLITAAAFEHYLRGDDGK